MKTSLTAAIQGHLREDRLPCASAFALAQEYGLSPTQVVAYAEEMGFRLGWCQLGLFAGAAKREKNRPPGQAEIPPALHSAIAAAQREGRLSCTQAWDIAGRLGVERSTVGRAADALGVRISRCQLGCFP